MDTHEEKHTYLVWGIILLVASVVIRLIVYPVISGDYTASISHWMDALHSPGLSAFKIPFSDYAPLYLYLLKILTFIPVYELFSIKTLSVAFDVILGLMAVKMVKESTNHAWDRSKLLLVFALVFVIPTVILNSSAWAQADSLYAAFVLSSLYFIYKDKPLWASILFSIAISFKLQAIFFLPILIGYLFSKKGRLPYLLTIPIVYFITIIPAWLAGGSFWQLLTVYGQQSNEFQALTLSAPTFFSFINEDALSPALISFLSYVGIILALVCAVWIVRKMLRMQKVTSLTVEQLTLLSLLSVISLPFFLPHMHERYFYLADVLSMMYVIIRPGRWYLPVLVIGASFFSYIPFLSGSIPFLGYWKVSEALLGCAMLVALISVWILVKRNQVTVESVS